MAVESAEKPIHPTKRGQARSSRPTQFYLVAIRRSLVPIGLGLILLSGAFFRFLAIDWDSGQHLHPDERFLTMVATGIHWPSSPGEYFDSVRSPLNPYHQGFGSYVYGTFPLFFTKLAAQIVGLSGYDGLHLVGRALSGLMDLASIVLIFFIGRRLYDARVGLLGAALLAFSVFNIQQSHFFTADMPANLMVTFALFFAISIVEGKGWGNFLGLGLFYGLAIASKLNLALFGIIVVLACSLRYFGPLLTSLAFQNSIEAQNPPKKRASKREALRKNISRQTVRPTSSEREKPGEKIPFLQPFSTQAPERSAVRGLLKPGLYAALSLIVILLVAFVTFRIAQPYAFSGPGFFDLGLSAQWREDMNSVSRLISGQADYPASHQWAFRTPYVFPWINMVRWGMGWALGLCAWAGLGLSVWELVTGRKREHLLVVVWLLALFFTLGGGFVLTMRYFLPMYPCLALMAAYFLIWLWDRAQMRPHRAGWKRNAGLIHRLFSLPYLAVALIVAVVVSTFLWAFAFSEIYRQPVSRVTASRWIYANVPEGATFGWEHWDDPLPLRVDGKDASFFYETVELPLYAEDSPEKLYGYPDQPGSGLLDKLDQVDWIFISSARLYSSIPRLPMRYPMTTKYYQALFSGELGFERVKTFHVFPSLLGWEINDQSAEEQFTVYDHPQVDLFRKTPAFSRERAEKLLGGIDWEGIYRLTPQVAMQAPNGLLLTDTDREVQQAGGTWSKLFNPDALANQNDLTAVLTWLLSIELLSLAALPISLLAFRRLPDRGYLLAKPLGMLLVSYIAWLLASLTPLPFTRFTILLGLALVGVTGGIVWSWQPSGLADYLQANKRLIVFQELLFLLFFIAFVLVRMENPDLWRPWTGGEKPMDFAYLNAILKSTRFPPYDPWFAGGYMNYYYLGFVLVASLIKLTGILPWIAYNLALPTLFAMTAGGAFSVVYNLTAGREEPARFPRAVFYGVFGALLVAVLGNLGEVRLILQGLRELGSLSFQTGIAWLDGLLRALSGLPLWLQGKELPIRPDWWYWNATRVMPGNEIQEFPFFTFLYGDLHAHMMALPLTLLAISGAVNLIRSPGRELIPRSLKNSEAIFQLLSLGILALIVGALKPINTWDYPTYLLVGFAALAVWGYHTHRARDLHGIWIGMIVFIIILRFVFDLGPELSLVLGILIGGGYGLAAGREAAIGSGLLAVGSSLLFIPFSRFYASAYQSAELWEGARTTLADYLTIHGFFLFVIATFLFVEWASWLKEGVKPAASTSDRGPGTPERGLTRLLASQGLLASQRNRAILSILGLAAAAVLGLFGLNLPAAVVILPLAGLSGLLILRPALSETRRFVFVLVLIGLLLTLLVELVVLKGDIGRSNTVFKFYLQVWVIWGVAVAASLPAVLAGLRRGPRFIRWSWIAGFTAIFLAAALYPVFATPAHIKERLDPSIPPTLNGMAFMDRGTISDSSYTGQLVSIELKYDRDALVWLQDHVTGSPVIAEANSTNLYHWTGRVSVWTGLPSLLGYNWHQKQQRSIIGGELIDSREQQANQLFLTEKSDEALALIQRFGVRYIYVGLLEQAFYPPAGLAKFESMLGSSLELAYENPGVRIYRVIK